MPHSAPGDSAFVTIQGHGMRSVDVEKPLGAKHELAQQLPATVANNCCWGT